MRTPKKRKVSTIALITLIIAVFGVVVYAATTFFHLDFNVNNTRGISISGSWTGNDIAGKEVIPGSTFQLSPVITNNSTDYVYLFVRIDTEENVYKISDLDSSWSVIKEDDGMILLAYGSESAMVQLEPGVEVYVSGTLTLDVSDSRFADLDNSALDFSVHACGIAKSQCDNHTAPLDVYDYYIENGGL